MRVRRFSRVGQTTQGDEKISLRPGTNFTDARWKGARGIETLLHCMTTPFSLAPPGRSSRGHFPAAPSAGWSSEGMAIAPAFVASIGVLVMTRRGDEYRRRAKTCFDAAHATGEVADARRSATVGRGLAADGGGLERSPSSSSRTSPAHIPATAAGPATTGSRLPASVGGRDPHQGCAPA